MSVAEDRKVLRLADEADENGLIVGKTYEDVVIRGPALLVPIEDVTFESNKFVVQPEGLFVVVPEGRPIQGGIGLRRVTFRRCELHNVSIAGTPEVIDQIRSQFEFPAMAAAEAQPAAAQY
jgi:hypothetical protein